MKKELVDNAIEMLIECGEPSEELQQKFIFSENGLKERLEKYAANPNISRDGIEIIKIIANCMNDLLKDYPAPAHYKEGLRKTFFDLFDEICYNYGFFEDESEELFDDIVDKYINDPTIEVIKLLHNQEGTTKQELSRKLGVSEKTVQTILHKLDNSATPLKLGGMPISVPINTFDDYSENCVYKKGDKYKKRRHYLTKNTMHPITYQMNLMQVGTLLYSLSKAYYEEEMYGAFYLALNTWCQLSEYAKERIKEIFIPRYNNFGEFIFELSEMLYNGARKFETENYLLKEEDDFSIEKKLLAVYNGELVCALELTNPRRRLRNQRVFFDFDKKQYYAVSTEDTDAKTDRTYLEKDNIFDLYEEWLRPGRKTSRLYFFYVL